MAIFFTADTHFGDRRVLQIDRRPFPSVAAHDEALVRGWNEVVGAQDEVWHLGDFALGPGPERVAALLAALNGGKHLVIGNNDRPATLQAAGWASVQHYAEIAVEGRRLVLAHYAFRTWNGMGRGAINLHGHSHGRLKPHTRQHDVGVDAWGYRPVRLDTILGRPRGNAARRGAGVRPPEGRAGSGREETSECLR